MILFFSILSLLTFILTKNVKIIEDIYIPPPIEDKPQESKYQLDEKVYSKPAEVNGMLITYSRTI